MEITIVKADLGHIEDCVDALIHSDIGAIYFSDIGKTRSMLADAVQRGEVFAALCAEERCLGFVWFMPKGVFGSYPYLHVLSVKEAYRGQGIGKQLLKYFEENASAYLSTKYFLTVDDFNIRAKKLYESLGYRQVGVLPDFYKKGTSCFLMIKEITR